MAASAYGGKCHKKGRSYCKGHYRCPLHARAILGLPVPEVQFYGPSASKAIVVEGNTTEYEFTNLEEVLSEPGVQIRIFGKPEIIGHRRVGVLLAIDETVEKALAKVERAYAKLQVKVY